MGLLKAQREHSKIRVKEALRRNVKVELGPLWNCRGKRKWHFQNTLRRRLIRATRLSGGKQRIVWTKRDRTGLHDKTIQT